MKRGWCPTLYAPMPSGDGLLVRVKPPGARLTPTGARAVAAAAERFGNGLIELTQRGNLQIRGLRPETTAAFATAMVVAALAEPDPAREARRAVMPPPLLGDDPGLAMGAAAFTARVEAAFQDDPRLDGLPPKFAVAVDAGGVLGGRPVAADLVAWTDGQASGVRLAVRGDAAAPVGLLAYPGTECGAFGLAPPFGQMDADLLRAAADLADRFDTALRVTPWRAMMLGRVPRIADIEAPGWIVDPADPRLLVTACVGSPGCAAAEAPARLDAARLRPRGPVHVSGCAKGCAHPGPAAAVLVGRDGRYDLVRNGRARDAPVMQGLTFEEAMGLV